MIFQDDTAHWHSEPVWVNWIYDEKRRLLMIFPLLENVPLPMQRLWCKVLKSVQATEWLAFFEGQSSELTVYKMIFSPQSLKRLITQLSPHKVWALGCECSHVDIPSSPPPSQWQFPGIKKQLWLNALQFLNP